MVLRKQPGRRFAPFASYAGRNQIPLVTTGRRAEAGGRSDFYPKNNSCAADFRCCAFNAYTCSSHPGG